MKIRTQFIVSASILGVILLGSLLLLLLINQRVQETREQELLATQIEREAYELGYLANDYLLYRDNQSAGRWESKFAAFSNDVSNLKANTRQEQGFVNNIKTNQQRLRDVFTEVRAGSESTPPTQREVADTAPLQVTWTLVEVQNQGMIFDAARLARVSREREDQMQQTTTWLNFGLVGLFGAFLFVTYGLIFRRTLTSLASLQTGTRLIGAGNLAYTLAENKQDEIGELAQAFNQMTANLRATTASKAELEREIEERKRAEERARRLASFPELNPNPEVEVNTSGNITFANPATDNLLARLGAKPGNVCALLPNGLDGILADWDQATTAVHYRETVVKDGVFGETITLIPQFKVARLYIYDITDRKRAEEAVQAERDRLSALINSITDEIWFADANENVALVNPAVWKEFGALGDQPIEETAAKFEVYRPDGTPRPPHEAPPLRALRGETVRDQEEIVRTPATGELRHRVVNGAPVRNGDGAIIGSVCVVRDVTERKRAEDALAHSNRKLSEVLNSIQDDFYVLDRDWAFVYASWSFTLRIGKEPQDFIGHCIWEMFPKHVGSVLYENFHATMGKGEIRRFEVGGQYTDAWYSMTSFPSSEGITVLGIDVTERKRAEERIHKLNEELERRAQDLEMTSEELRVTNEELQGANEKLRIANLNFEAALAQEQSTRLALQATNKELEAFTYTVAHDLRAPLNQIEQFSDMLLKDYRTPLAEPGQRLVHLIHANASSINGLAEDLLTLSRLTQQSPVKRSVNMQQLVEHVMANLKKEQASRPVEWVVGDLPSVEADPVLLKQVWLNLMVNALKFTRPRAAAHIEIGSFREQGHTVYYIKDDGIGFDMSQAARLFRAFHRLHHHEDYEGNGLGLAIVDRIIRRHGGRVWANAQVDGGATFYFTLAATEVS